MICMLKVIIGNIFETKVQTLVNTVNCVGVMGKGVASTFKAKYPLMFNQYKDMCDRGEIKTGTLYPYFENGELKVINFPTKQHWRSPSQLSYITEGLDWFVSHYEELGIESIAFPPLGCGNGGLSWTVVGPVIYNKLSKLPIYIEVYAPFGTPEKELTEDFLSNMNKEELTKGTISGRVNKNWLLVLRIVKCLNNSKYSIKVGRTVFQKICYVLQRYGTDLSLTYVKGYYGPYSQNVKNMITILSNNNLIIEKADESFISISVTNEFKIDPKKYSEKDKINANKTFDLFKRIKNTYQTELITTILFSFDEMSKSTKSITENMLYDYIVDWKKRLGNPEDESRIRELAKYLTLNGFIGIDYSCGYKDSAY